MKIGPYSGCYPQLPRVPVLFVWHQFRKEEIKRKNRKKRKATPQEDDEVPKTSFHSDQVCKYFVKKDEYFILPYQNCRIVSKSSKNCGKGKGEGIFLRLPNGKQKKFRKSHVVLSACLPLIFPNQTVEHLDMIPHKNNSNRLNNIVWMSAFDNSRRAGLLCPVNRRKKSTSSQSRAIKRISVLDTDDVQIFPSSREATQKTAGTNQGSICDCANGKRNTHPRGVYRWEWVPQEIRTPPAGKKREVIYLKNLPEAVKSLAYSLVEGKLRKGRTPKPPRACSNLGEILTRQNKWTIGSCKTRAHAKARRYQNVNVSNWIYLFFHGMFDPSTQQINHMDGNQNNPLRFSKDTYLTDGTTYSNYAWTIYAGTAKENMEDLSAAAKRQRKLL